MNKPTLIFITTLLLILCGGASLRGQPAANQAPKALTSVLGTCKGESICVGNRPACKNEVVVYRFEAIEGKVGVILLLADKIIEGRRDPMGKLEFQYDEARGELSCEFTIRQTQGVWQFKVSGDAMEGTLMLLPDRELMRQVIVKRVKEDEVPAAPARKAYENM